MKKKLKRLGLAVVAGAGLYVLYVGWYFSITSYEEQVVHALDGATPYFVPSQMFYWSFIKSDTRVRRMMDQVTIDFVLTSGHPDSEIPESTRLQRALRIAQAMLDAGADINKPGVAGYTPLQFAIQASDEDVTKFLMERGAHACGGSLVALKSSAPDECARMFLVELQQKRPEVDRTRISELIAASEESEDGEL